MNLFGWINNNWKELTEGDSQKVTEGLQVLWWEPIKTAPMDGTHIFVSDGFFMRMAFWSPTQKRWVDFNKGFDEIKDLSFTPTHWMPIPDPPNKEKA